MQFIIIWSRMLIMNHEHVTLLGLRTGHASQVLIPSYACMHAYSHSVFYRHERMFYKPLTELLG